MRRRTTSRGTGWADGWAERTARRLGRWAALTAIAAFVLYLATLGVREFVATVPLPRPPQPPPRTPPAPQAAGAADHPVTDGVRYVFGPIVDAVVDLWHEIWRLVTQVFAGSDGQHRVQAVVWPLTVVLVAYLAHRVADWLDGPSVGSVSIALSDNGSATGDYPGGVHLLAELRQALASVSLRAPSTVPGESEPQGGFLGDIQAAARANQSTQLGLGMLVVAGALRRRADFAVHVTRPSRRRCAATRSTPTSGSSGPPCSTSSASTSTQSPPTST